MIQPVPAEQLPRLLPLFDFDLPNRVMLLSFLDGRSLGTAFVDDLQQPTACIVVADFSNFTFIGGTPDAAWLAQAVAELRRQRYLLLITAAWLPNGGASLPDADRILPRWEFLHPQQERRTPPVALPEGYDFRLLDADLLARCQWRDDMIRGYGSAEKLLAEGIGVCLMHGDEICCETYAMFPADGHYEIGIVTYDDYQRRGFGYATCVRLMDECARRGFDTTWSCDQDNPASAATARKLGYSTEREYQLLYYAPQD